MVNQGDTIDRVFAALADPTRRAILERLADGDTPVAALAAPHAMSAPAISKHLRALEQAGLIARRRVGRAHLISAEPAPAEAAARWIETYAAHWRARFEAVDAYLAMKGTRHADDDAV